MFDAIFQAIEVWMRTLLTSMVKSNLQNMFAEVNQSTADIATRVGQTPQGWNGSIFSMIRNLSNTVILPIAGMVITFVVCYELISMLTEKNNMHDIDTWMFFKYIFKMMIAVYLLSNTYTITMAIFDLGQHVVNSAGDTGSGTCIPFYNGARHMALMLHGHTHKTEEESVMEERIKEDIRRKGMRCEVERENISYTKKCKNIRIINLT